MENGLFITLRDERSLALYLREGVFSQHQPAQMDDDVHHGSNHYKVIADYACAREGTHVFFFRERAIYYGGRVTSGVDDDSLGAFWINGATSPMGRRAQAGLGWDETVRDDYEEGDQDGVFVMPGRDGPRKMAQPFLIRFDTDVEDTGKYIRSDDLYFELGDYPFPLQSNTIRGAGFCAMGPGETRRLLEQIEQSEQTYDPESEPVEVPDVTLDEEEIEPFRSEYGIDSVKRANLTNEDQLEASVIANPSLLPEEIRPDEEQSIVRQAPISPLKPMQVDEIDVCFYDSDFEDGMYPKDVLELKYSKASGSSNDAEQIRRYREAIDKMANHHLDADPNDIQVWMYAPEYDEDHFGSTIEEETIRRITFRQFEVSPETPSFTSQISSY